MKVTIRIDDDLRKKGYWRNVQDSEEFEYLRDRAPVGAVLKDRQGRMVFCAKDRLIFPVEVIPEPIPESPPIEPDIDKTPQNDESVTKESE